MDMYIEWPLREQSRAERIEIALPVHAESEKWKYARVMYVRIRTVSRNLYSAARYKGNICIRIISVCEKDNHASFFYYCVSHFFRYRDFERLVWPSRWCESLTKRLTISARSVHVQPYPQGPAGLRERSHKFNLVLNKGWIRGAHPVPPPNSPAHIYRLVLDSIVSAVFQQRDCNEIIGAGN